VGVLDEGDEVELVSGLKLCLRSLHREPVIELCGADPYKFAELPGLGLINEQIDWKQRFFIPTDEEKGIAVLDSLLARYPAMQNEVSGESEITDIELKELSRPQTVNLDEWFVPVTETVLVSPLAPDETESAEPASSLSVLYVAPVSQQIPDMQLALDFG
jgi:hypothetical protein